jgi:hypothetical protein
MLFILNFHFQTKCVFSLVVENRESLRGRDYVSSCYLVLMVIKIVGTFIECLTEWQWVFDDVSEFRSLVNKDGIGYVPKYCFEMIAVTSVEYLTRLQRRFTDIFRKKFFVTLNEFAQKSRSRLCA